MTSLIEELETLAQEGRNLATASAPDIAILLAWGRRRESVLVRLKNIEKEVAGAETGRAAALIRQIADLGAAMVGNLEQELKRLETEIAATSKMRQLLQSHSGRRPALLQRTA